jgi:hypothetical protein
MLTATAHDDTATIRNYALIAAAIIFMTSGLTDVFFNPNRLGQQGRLDTYSNVISAGLVNQANNLGR